MYIIGYVARPKPEVFDITKRKFHNVLQGVAAPDVRLTDSEKQMFIDWSDENAKRFWIKDGGPIRNSDVIVIDDPQCKVFFFIYNISVVHSVTNTRIFI